MRCCLKLKKLSAMNAPVFIPSIQRAMMQTVRVTENVKGLRDRVGELATRNRGRQGLLGEGRGFRRISPAVRSRDARRGQQLDGSVRRPGTDFQPFAAIARAEPTDRPCRERGGWESHRG